MFLAQKYSYVLESTLESFEPATFWLKAQILVSILDSTVLRLFDAPSVKSVKFNENLLSG